MSQTTPDLLTQQAELERRCRGWRDTGYFAFDTEFIKDDTFDAVLCLIQVAGADGVTLIDPTAGLELAVFWELVADPAVCSIVHSGKEDCDLCLRLHGAPPRNIFDVQVAAGFAGWGYPLSLARLVEHGLGKRLVKGQTLTNWLRRPLTPEQLHYAIEDVAHLPELHQRLSKRLDALGRTGWADEEFARFADPDFYRPPLEDRLERFKGSKRLDSLGLLVLSRLIEWREAWAREKNRPQRALMRDDILVEIAKRRPRKESDYEVLRGFPQARNLKLIREIIAIIDEAAKSPRSAWPTPHEFREISPMENVTLDLVSAVTQAICFEEHISPALLGGARHLRDLLDHLAGRQTDTPHLLSGWRAAFIGQRLTSFLSGRSELHLSGWPDDPRLKIVLPGAADS